MNKKYVITCLLMTLPMGAMEVGNPQPAVSYRFIDVSEKQKGIIEAIVKKKCIGSLVYNYSNPENIELRNLSVDEKYRQQRIGFNPFKMLIEKLQSQKAPLLSWTAMPLDRAVSLAHLINFYAKSAQKLGLQDCLTYQATRKYCDMQLHLNRQKND